MTTPTDQSIQLSSNNSTYNFKSDLVKISDGLFTCPLTLRDGNIMNIQMREDGYINVTLIAKACGKRIDNWIRRKETKQLINYISKLPQNEEVNIIDIKEGKYGGTYYHPDFAIPFAQWCSPTLAIQVSRWTRELLLFGKVELGQEKTNKELETRFQEQIRLLTQEKDLVAKQLLTVTRNHNNILRRRKRDLYEIGNVVYIVSHEAFTQFYKDNYHKIGLNISILI